MVNLAPVMDEAAVNYPSFESQTDIAQSSGNGLTSAKINTILQSYN